MLLLRNIATAEFWRWRELEYSEPTANDWELLVSCIAALNMEIFRGR